MGKRIPDVSQRTLVRAADAWTPGPDGRTTLRRRRLGTVASRIARVAGVDAEATIVLDRLGSAAWDLADGSRTAGQVLEALRDRFPEERDLAPRFSRFLSTLVGRGFLRLE